MRKAFVATVAALTANIASAQITIEDLENASIETKSLAGALHACSARFSDDAHAFMAMKIESAFFKLHRVSDFESENLAEVHIGKVWVSTRLAKDVLAGMGAKGARTEAKKWCDENLASSRRLLSRLESKIRIAER